MDPHSFIARAEAQRWLGIAEKLLISHDLVGSKTFAIRARESDPRLEAADQILAIADTLLAAEKRVVGTNGAHQPDYYAILQLVRFVQDTDHIASQFRRLAVAVNPHHNRFPYADQAFQLVNDAWAVLSNPMRKSMYDSDLDYPSQQQMNTLGFNIEQQQQQQHQQQQHHQQHQQQQQQQQQQQPHNFFSINHIGGSHEQSHQHQHQQLQQHNFLPQVQPFQVNSPPHQQTRPSPQPQGHIQSPPATPQHPFSWPQASQMSQQLQHHQIKQEQQHHQQLKQEQHMQQHLKQEQQIKQQQLHQEQLKQQQMQQEQLKQQKLQQEQLKQQQLQEEQRKQQQMMEEQRKQQQLMEEQRKQQQLQEEQRRQQQMLEEQRKQQQLLEEQRKQQQLLEEQRKQQQLLEEQRKQQQLLEEQRKQQQLLEEQRKQQQLLEEQRKQQQLLEEQRKQQQLLEEQRKQQQLLEEQQKQQKLLEEQRKQQQLLEEQRKQQQLEEEQRKQQQLEEEQRKQQQLQEEQRKQQQLQEEQQKQQQEQQQQESVKHNATPVQHPSWVNSNNGVRDEEIEPEPVDDSPTFWTACPFCFYMYEYPKVYVECTLRCDNCKRAYQAVRISSPPPIIEGQDAYFYCWGFFPIGVSMSDMQQSNNKVRNSNWTPFSSLHNASNNVQNHLNEQAAPKENPFVNKSSGPRICFDDITDDVFIGVSEPSSDSDTEWVGTKKQKSKRTDKGFEDRIQVLALRAVYTGNGSVKNLKHGIPVQEGVEVPTVLVVEAGKINVGSNPRKQPSRVAQELGKLDLNVEFNNNEGEETVPRMTAGTRTHEQGEEESVEGTEFFEGLDEYLSSLPILSVVNEEKVMAA